MPLQIGRYAVDPPVVLAPMAGITNAAFRQLCREQAEAAASSMTEVISPTQAPCTTRGLYVCEMVTARAVLIRNEKTMRMVEFSSGEHPRSLQLYGVDPAVVADAVRMVADEDLADHIDLNFGCPVPKVTRKGGGSALPWRRRLFSRVVAAAVDAASPAGIPVTVKMRKGIDADHLTFRYAGLAAQDAGAAAVTLHGRTTVQGYSGRADWAAIADLKRLLTIPVLGNGDLWEAEDALRMVAATGADGVVIGRGALGRPWLFGDLAAAFNGELRRALPTLGQVAATMRRHATLLVERAVAAEERAMARGTDRVLIERRPRGWSAEGHACADFRKHVAWYLKGFAVGSRLRRDLAMVSSLAELGDLLCQLDAEATFPERQLGQPRGRTTASARVILPEGWLDDPDSDEVPEGGSA
ncbi:MAG: tRNA dihydrouridine synthase DusB [Micromonosporaceae bacterium]|nr:tRNA dihydrouridine synthase DusB [Micromonosporaceae bacterium]